MPNLDFGMGGRQLRHITLRVLAAATTLNYVPGLARCRSFS